MKRFIKAILIIFIILNTSLFTNAQIAINSDGSSPDESAMLDVISSSKGILIPRMTTIERTAISSPATGLLVYDTDFNTFWYYANSAWNNLSSSILTDLDGNTKIQVEESSDEDVIRFDLAGTEFMRLDSGRIETVNTGKSVFLGEDAGLNDDFSDNESVFIGYRTGKSNTSGDKHLLIGFEAGILNTTGVRNHFLGYRAGYNNTTGGRNMSLGFKSGFSTTTGGRNVCLGYESGYSNTTGSYSVLLGYQAGYSETNGNRLYIENSNSSSPLIYGEFDNDWVKINGTLSATDGFADSDNDTKIQVEESSDEDVIRFDLGGTEFMRLDSGRIEILNTGSSVFIGEGAGENDALTDNQNVFIGYQTGKNNSEGHYNTFLGYESGYSNTTGVLNTFVGRHSGYSNTTGQYNIFLGIEAGHDNTTGDKNVFLGLATGHSMTTGEQNVFLGGAAGYNNTTGSRNVFIGNSAGFSETVSDRLYIDNSTTSSPLIYGEFDNDILEINGDVGIGISPTKAILEIDGDHSLQSFTSTHGLLSSSGASTSSSRTKYLSIYASSNVAAKTFIAFSDARIKNIQGVSNSKNDLTTLMNIQITDYTMKDTIEGNQIIKKVIAQQVAKIYPQAVNANLTDVIPDIYQKATIQNGWIELTTDLEVGEKVQIIFKDKKEILEVLETKGNSFRIETLQCNVCTEESTVFIYGRQVDDFHTVDYEAISMLNVSATQQLAKENETLKTQVEQQQIEINQLKVQVQKINELEAKLEVFLNQ